LSLCLTDEGLCYEGVLIYAVESVLRFCGHKVCKGFITYLSLPPGLDGIFNIVEGHESNFNTQVKCPLPIKKFFSLKNNAENCIYSLFLENSIYLINVIMD
jgi:hypothetical protein